MIKEKNNKRGQITIFIILALIIVVLIALIFVSRIPSVKVEQIDEKSPQAFIESCTKDSVKKALEKISENGDIRPNAGVMYNGINRTYLCYTSELYNPCINQRPMLIEYFEKEITEYIRQDILNCFSALKLNLEKRYNIEMSEMKLSTKLKPKEIVVEIKRKFKMSREDKTKEFDGFKILVMHPLYRLSETAMEIVNQEAQFCSFDTLGFMIIYPQYDIRKFKTGDSDIIYTVKERKSSEEYNFAVRSCVQPAGV